MKFEILKTNILKKAGFLALVLLLAGQSLFAKDSVSVSLGVGAVGYERVLTNSSTSTTYTKTTFNPDFALRLNFPLVDFKENCFLGLDLGYDISWERQNSSNVSNYADMTLFTHKFSLLPELTFLKGDLRFFVGTGISFGINSYESKNETTSSITNQEYTFYQILWISELGLKYYLTEKLFLAANIDISIPFSEFRRGGSQTTTSSGSVTKTDYTDYTYYGRSSVYFCPKVSVSYSF